ncbi:hypothetical protein D3C75_1161530 [compost metagenome]
MHVAQCQPAHMPVFDAGWQRWQGRYGLAVNEQLVLVVAIHQLAPPATAKGIHDTAPTDGVDRRLPVGLPGP